MLSNRSDIPLSTLSSDILSAQFGALQHAVVDQNAKHRIITNHTADGRLLELSFVSFLPQAAALYPKVQQIIVDGAPMGETFREHGVDFHREQRGQYILLSSDQLSSIFGTKEELTMTRVRILVGVEREAYAEIVEIYAPIVIWPGTRQSLPSHEQQNVEALLQTLPDGSFNDIQSIVSSV